LRKGLFTIPGLSGIHEPSSAGREAVPLAFLIAWLYCQWKQKTRNLRVIQLLLGHKKLESTVRYLGIEVDDALEISESIEV
jgi:hypothetical protein